MDFGLENQRVLVTGASGGIGAAIVRVFAREGARVACHGFRNEAALAALVEGSPRMSAYRADLRDERQVESLFDNIDNDLNGLDHLVVNAGVWVREEAPVRRMDLAQWVQTIDANLTSAFLCCRAFLRRVERDQLEAPSITLVGSTAALFGEAGHADYAASKAGLVYGVLPSLKNEIIESAPRGRVNAVCPGWTATPMTAENLADSTTRRRSLATMSLSKVATPEDIATSVVFLSSARVAGHITGAILPVSGGMEGRLLHGELHA
ncbi:MAG: SDR family NAD(P)-dependent oxidoreductase [Phycisphaerales bacterium]